MWKSWTTIGLALTFSAGCYAGQQDTPPPETSNDNEEVAGISVQFGTGDYYPRRYYRRNYRSYPNYRNRYHGNRNYYYRGTPYIYYYNRDDDGHRRHNRHNKRNHWNND